MIDQLDGRCIRTFIAVLEEKSISRAAEKLGYVQSTVTTQIGLLERTCGRKLFDRLPRGVEPTEAGRQLARFAYRFMELGQSLEEALERLEEPSGTLRVRALESFCVERLPGLLSAYVEQYPRVKLHLSTGFMADITEHVLEQRSDIGIVPQDPQHEALTFVPLTDEKLVWVTGADSDLQHGSDRSAQQRNLIGFGRQCVYNGLAEAALQAAGVPLGGMLEFPSTELIKRMVRCDLGLALLPEANVRAELEAGTLRTVELGAPPVLTHGLIYLRGRELRAAAEAFVRCTEKHFHYADEPGMNDFSLADTPL